MNFEFNKGISYASAFYRASTDTITLNFGDILRCDKITDDEKIRLITWQIEHEVMHSAIFHVAGGDANVKFDYVTWTIQDKKEFLEIMELFKKVGYSYYNNCKHLGSE